MHTIPFLNQTCVELANPSLSLLVTQSVGPRILSLRYQGGENLLAELPGFMTETPAGTYHFYGGHRLWRAPEALETTYALDNDPVAATLTANGLTVTQMEPHLKKSIHLALHATRPLVEVTHTLTNLGPDPMTLAVWAITQLKPGGVAILPHSTEPTGFLPNRALALWPYTDIRSPHLTWGNAYTLVHAQMTEGALKVGFPNPRGWLAYWRAGTVFVKRAAFDLGASYYDFGSSSECYCGVAMLELETLSPIHTLAPGESIPHVETWEVFGEVDAPHDEASAARIVERLGLSL
ncbi:MAG TPA: hypothetical protein PK530_08805 [Anaerolineales bacterium]|nr:hypothetical protein [Anaerolineales bacterium]